MCNGVILEHLVHPVGISVDALILRPVNGRLAVVDGLLVHDGHILVGIQQVNLASHVLPAEVAVEGDDGASFLTAFSSDEHDTVGRLCAVDSC